MNSYRVMFVGNEGEGYEANYFAHSLEQAVEMFRADFGDVAIDGIEEESEDDSEHCAYNDMLEGGRND